MQTVQFIVSLERDRFIAHDASTRQEFSQLFRSMRLLSAALVKTDDVGKSARREFLKLRTFW
jgi:hypothetical protein